MSSQAHSKKKIAAFSSARARFALTAQTDSLSFMNAARDLNLVIFHFIRAGPAQRDCSGRSVQRFFKCDHDVGFDIGATLRSRLTSAKSAESRAAAATAEKCFEEVAEPRSVELELNSAAIAAPLIKSAAGLLSLPLPVGRWLEPTRTIPIRAELIVFFTLFGIAQHLVGFVDFLKFFLGGLFILGDIGMIFPGQLAKSATDLLLGGGFRNTECLVIISELYWHSLSNLCLRPVRATFCTMRELGKFIVIMGVIATLVGLMMWSGFAPKWLGRLPGDIRIEREHSTFYFPIVTCIVLSIVLSLLLSIFSIFRR